MTGEQHVVLFGGMDGTDCIIFDMVGDDGLALAALPAQARPEAAMAVLRAHFGPSVDQRVEVLHVTNGRPIPMPARPGRWRASAEPPSGGCCGSRWARCTSQGEAAFAGPVGHGGRSLGGEGERAAMQALARLGSLSV